MTPPAPRAASPWLLLASAVAVLFFSLPLLGLLSRVPLRDALSLIEGPEVQQAFGLSLVAAGGATAFALAFGFPLAWLLARTRIRGAGILRALVAIPMVLPPVVAGVALLAAFGRRGLLGDSLDAIGIALPFSTAAVVLAACFVAAPFLILTLEAALADADPRYEQVAATLGASRARIFFGVVLPAIRRPLLAGLALCFARALGEFGATITFAGNLPGRTQTLPLAVYELLQTRPQDAFLLSCFLLIVALALLAALRGYPRLR